MSTIGVTETLGIRDHLAARKPGAVFVDAPVPGSKDPAERGQLLLLASGPPQRPHGRSGVRRHRPQDRVTGARPAEAAR